MASLNKKTFVYSNDMTKQLCEGLLKDRSVAAKVTESVIIENAILDALLPKNEDASLWVQRLYDGETLADAYARTFCYLAAGTFYRAAHDNGLSLVEKFRRLVSVSIYRFTGQEKEFPHLLQQLTYLLEIFPEHDALHDRHLLEYFVKQLSKNPEEITAQDLTSFIHLHFDVLGNITHTYRALMDIACAAKDTLPNTPTLRTIFIDTLAAVSAGW